MNNSFDLLNLLIMWSVGLISVIGLLIITLISVIRLIFQKAVNFNFVKGAFLTLFIVGFVLSLPFLMLLPMAGSKSHEIEAKWLRIAEKVAIIPTVKADMNYELSVVYSLMYRGKEAIEHYEKAVKINGKENAAEKLVICRVYFDKGDSENIQKTCPANQIALDYMRNKDYDNALKIINSDIEKKQAENVSNICHSYATRAYIYKNMKEKAAYKKDYKIIKKSCSPEYFKRYAESDFFDNLLYDKKYQF